MLELLRRGGKTWVAKIFFIVLVAAFAGWGVKTSIFASSADAVVRVGDEKVSNTEFKMAFNRAMSQYSRSMPNITLEQAKMFGIENAVISDLITSASLDQLASKMKLGLSEDKMLEIIQQEQFFKDERGAFSRARMESVLGNSGIRVEDYLKLTSRQAVRSQIVDALSGGFTPSKSLEDALKTYSNERRSIDYIILTNANIDPVAAPSQPVIEKWYAENKSKYRAPEYRKFTYVKLEPADIADPAVVTEQAIKDDYEKHKDAYRTAEMRTVEQLAFANKADADAAATKLAAGTTFDQLVTEQGKTPTDVLLGDFTKDKMPNPAMADAVFGVKTEGGVTPVVNGILGPVIIRVTNIRPEVVKTLVDVKADIRKQLALVQANDDFQSVFDRFEDARAGGASLSESAKQLQLKSVTVDAADQSGHDPKDKEIAGLPEPARLLTEVFKTEPGVEALPLTLDGGGSVWFEVNDIIAARDRTLEEVKDKVIADWTREQQQAARAKKGEEISKRIASGDKLADVAKELKLAVETKSDVRRGMDDAVLGGSTIAAAFGGPDGFATSAQGADTESQIVLVVTDVKEDVATDALDESSERAKMLAASAANDILDQVINELQNEYGVSVNRTLAQQLMVR